MEGIDSARRVLSSTSQTIELGRRIGELARPNDVVELVGQLGAGKTHLAKGVAQGLGIEDEICSPTFNLMFEYSGRIPLYHFDLYRLDEPGQLEDIGFFEALEAGGISLIEWADKFDGFMPDELLSISISIRQDGARIALADARGNVCQHLLEAFK